MKPPANLLAICFGLVLATPCLAARINRTATAAAVITDGAGNSRLLLRWDAAPTDEFIAVSRAILSFDLSGEATARTLSLHVYPVTAPWNPATVEWTRGWAVPGGDIDVEASAAADIDLSRGSGAVRIDMTDAIKATLEDRSEFHGLLITCDPSRGDGISTEDAARFANMANASIELSYRRVPAPPAELATQDSVTVR